MPPYTLSPPPHPKDPNYNTRGSEGRRFSTWGFEEDNSAWLVGMRGRGGSRGSREEENNNGGDFFPPTIRPFRSLTSSPSPPSPSPPPSPLFIPFPPLRSPSPSPFSPTHASSITHSPTLSSTLREFSPFPSPSLSPSPPPLHDPSPSLLPSSPSHSSSKTMHNPFPSPSPSPPLIPPFPLTSPSELVPLGCHRRRPASRGLLTRCHLPKGVPSLPNAIFPHPRRPLTPRPPLALTCEGPRGESEARGPSFFTDLCSLWPDLIVR